MAWRRSLALIGVCLTAALSAQPQRPNIVFVLADDLGWTDLSTPLANRGHASDYYRTPNIDALAARGMSFDQAYANGPNCTPTRAALMSGLYAARTRTYAAGSTNRGDARYRRLDGAPQQTWLDASVLTLPEVLKTVGYANGAFGKWHLGDDPDIGPRAQGFDFNAGGTGAGVVTGGSNGHFARANGSWGLPNLPANGIAAQFMAERLTDEAIAWMTANAQRAFFCYLSHFSVHLPIQAPAADLAAFDGVPKGRLHRDQTYAAMLKNLDDGVGRVVRFLESTDDPRRPGAKLIENTVVIFTSDNGGLGGYADAGIAGGDEITNQAPLRSGKGSLCEGGIRVPLIVRWDGRVAPGSTSGVPLLSIDLLPTCAELAGAIQLAETDGLSFLRILRGRATDLGRSSLFWHFPGYVEASSSLGTWVTTPASAIRRGDWKLHFEYETRSWRLFDLASDPGERIDRSGVEPEVVRALGGELRAWLQATAAELPRFKGSAIAVPLPEVAVGGGDDVAWRLSPSRPLPRSDHALASTDRGVVLFGGCDEQGPTAATWRFEDDEWTALAPVGAPPARRGHAACWDAGRHRLVVFGGEDAGGGLLGDTWEFGDDAWSAFVGGRVGPSPRLGLALVFEPTRGAIVLFGGRDAGGPRADTWTFDGRQWRQRTPVTSPPARSDHGLVHDVASGRTFLFGGADAGGAPLADTWVWDGQDWTPVNPASSPAPRSAFALAWDSIRARAVLWGGRDANGWPLADTWEFDGAAWRERHPASAPLAASVSAGAFDPILERTVLLGGRNGAQQARTWVYGARVQGRVLLFGAAGCPGAGPPPVLTASRPWVGETWVAHAGAAAPGPLVLLHGSSRREWVGLRLPLALDALGAPGCTLLVAADSSRLPSMAGGTEFRLAVPAQPSLVGRAFYAQLVRVDASANALGIVTGSALEGVIGAR